MLESAPRSNDAAAVLVAVPDGDLEHFVARQLRVVIDESLLALEADLFEEIPQLDDVGDRAALVIGIVGKIAVERRIGLVEELLAARHHRIAGQLLGPRAELTVE